MKRSWVVQVAVHLALAVVVAGLVLGAYSLAVLLDLAEAELGERLEAAVRFGALNTVILATTTAQARYQGRTTGGAPGTLRGRLLPWPCYAVGASVLLALLALLLSGRSGDADGARVVAWAVVAPLAALSLALTGLSWRWEHRR